MGNKKYTPDWDDVGPELLEELENVLKLIDCFEMRNCPHVKEDGGCGGADEDCDWLINSRAAIAKAHGE